MRSKKAVWQVVLRPSGARLVDGSTPSMLVWVEADSERVRLIELVPDSCEIGWSRIFEAASKRPLPGCVAALPEEILVEDELLRGGLQGAVGALGVKVTLRKKLKLINDICDNLFQLMADGPGFSYLDGTEIQPEEVAALAGDTVNFLLARPFEVINGDDVLQVEGLSLSPVFVSVLGMGEMEYGLGIYLNREAAETYLGGITEELMGVLPTLSLTLVTEEDCPTMLDFEIRTHQWPCHPLGFPMLMRVDGDRAQPTSEEIRLARDLLRLVVCYAEEGRDGRYTLDGRKLTIKPLTQRDPRIDLRALVFSQLMLDTPPPQRKRGRTKR